MLLSHPFRGIDYRRTFSPPPTKRSLLYSFSLGAGGLTRALRSDYVIWLWDYLLAILSASRYSEAATGSMARERIRLGTSGLMILGSTTYAMAMRIEKCTVQNHLF